MARLLSAALIRGWYLSHLSVNGSGLIRGRLLFELRCLLEEEEIWYL